MPLQKVLTYDRSTKLLWRQQLEAGARQEAWTFVAQQEWHLELIREDLAEREDTRGRESAANWHMAPGASPRVFVDAYIATLKDAIAIIEIHQAAMEAHTAGLVEAQKQFWRQSLEAGAHQVAWTFVVEHDWNLEQLREELAEYEDMRNQPITEHSPMKPGNSPRIFADAYIATLKEAIEIIEIQSVEPADKALTPSTS